MLWRREDWGGGAAASFVKTETSSPWLDSARK
jgi:hypothetical protein